MSIFNPISRALHIIGFILLVSLSHPGLVTAKMPTVEGGFLNLTAWNFDENVPIPLSGTWEFYWNQLLDPTHFAEASPPAPGGMLSVPGSWNAFLVDDRAVGPHGFATYRLLIELPTATPRAHPSVSSSDLALHIPWAFTAYRLWLNGDMLAANGHVGADAATMRPQSMPTTVSFTTDERTLEIVIQVSNFMHRNGGLWNVPVLGSYETVVRRQHIRSAAELLLAGALFVMAMYHLVLYGSFRKNSASLYLGLTSFVIALRTVLQGEQVLSQALPQLAWDVTIRAEYVTGYAFLITFVGLLRALYPVDMSPVVASVARLVGGAGIIITLLAPVAVSSVFILYYMIVFALFVLYAAYTFFLAARRQRPGARLILAGGLILTLTLAHDLLHYNLLGLDFNLIPLGLFCLLLAQSLALARDIAYAFNREIAVSKENAALANTVSEQLQRLQQSQQMLIEADENLRRDIAEKLHGRVQNRLLRTWLRLDELKKTLEKGPTSRDDRDSASDTEILSTTVAAARRITDEIQVDIDNVREVEIRQVSHMLHPVAVQVGIVPAITSLARDFGQEFNIDIHCNDALHQWDDPAHNRIAKDIRLATYRAVEEALVNVSRHAQATTITINVAVEEEHLHVTVADNGQGFDVTSVRGNFGFNAIDARVTGVGGTWKIVSEIERGTTVFFTIPLHDRVPDTSGTEN